MENYIIPQGYKLIASLDLGRMYQEEKLEQSLICSGIHKKRIGILPLSSGKDIFFEPEIFLITAPPLLGSKLWSLWVKYIVFCY